MRTLYLIDGYAQFFRAYHAIRTPMTSPVTGEPTNLTFGFVGMLLKLLRGEGHAGEHGGPHSIAVALDVSGDRGTFRSQLYPEYKATRDAPPEDLPQQVERCLSLLKAIGVPCIGSEGFEADDVIAAVAAQRADDQLIRVVSKDKDLKQLLKPDALELYDIHTDVVIDAASLADDTGITPEQVVDMLALMGDNVDNVPGVPGVGPKTAAQLVAEFGTLDAVIAEVQADKPKKDWKIKGKRRENIAAFADKLPLSRELVTLRADAPIEFDASRCDVDALNLAALMPILRELGFNRYQDDLKDIIKQRNGSDNDADNSTNADTDDAFGTLFAADSGAERKVDGSYRCVRTKSELDDLVAELTQAEAIAIDTETTAIRPMLAELVGLSFSTEPGTGWYVPVRAPEGEMHLDETTVLDALRPIIEDAAKPKIGHNLKYDLIVLHRAGVQLSGLEHAESCDTMVASYLIDASRSSHSLDALSLALLGRTNIPISDLIGKGKSQRTFDTVPLDRATDYAAEDADVTLQLARLMQPELRAQGLHELMTTLEMPLVGVLAELEINGILVDPDELSRQRERLETRIAELRSEIQDSALDAIGRGFDTDSPKQLSEVLFNKPDAEPPGLGLKPIKKTKTGYSTDAEVLDKLTQDPTIDSPIPGLVLDYRQLAKLVNTYLASLTDDIHPETKRIHASFNQTVAATGRLSSSDPNLQNIPIRTDVGREIRRAFVAPEGRVLISADYSQIELRLLAHLSRDPALIEAFQRGEDIHRAVAAQIHSVALDDVTREQRSGAKMVNFGIVYGITPFGLARRLGVSNGEATDIIDSYKRKFAGITTFLEECVEYARSHGYVETMMKRRRPITDIDARNPQRKSLAERMAINSVVQGSAADLIKLAMVNIQREIDAAHFSPAGGGGEAEGRDGGGEFENVGMLLQIHDELVFEAPANTADAARETIVDRMQRAMEGHAELSVPLEVDSAISDNWFEGK